jgi:cytochrome bd ubiquinol oxidase subunit II
MIFQITWFILWGVLWAVYFMLDGFDFGVSILQPFIAKNDAERRLILNSIGPVWDGNEVWLITAGGATFAAFPTTYAVMFSALYTPLFIILCAIIVRGVSIEFRGKSENPLYRRVWDWAFVLGSFVPALLFGVAFGNIFQGLPMDASGYHGTLFTLLNPYGILTGALFVLLFAVHGALWLSVRTEGAVLERARGMSMKLWPVLAVVAVAFLVATAFATKLYDNYLSMPFLAPLPVLAVLSLLAAGYFTFKGRSARAFVSSCLTILMVTFTGVAGLYPNLIPSSLDEKFSLTIFNSSSSQYTLTIMTVVALIFVPVVILYQAWTYKVFSERISVESIARDEDAY